MWKTCIDLTDQIFNYWTVIERCDPPSHLKSPQAHKRAYWWCKCRCGNEKAIGSSQLRYGKSQSCGCYGQKKISINANIPIEYPQKHNLKNNNDFYCLWNSLLRKCYSKKCSFYHLYGEKGITVCDEWKSAENFIHWAMGTRPAKNYSLELNKNEIIFNPETVHWMEKGAKIAKTKKNQGEYCNLKLKYNSLNVVGEKYITHGKHKKLYIICQCDCGTFVNVAPHSLIHGLTKTCGCRNRKYQWSLEYSSCKNCHQTKRKHAKEGLCKHCYDHLRIDPNWKFDKRAYKKNWSEIYDECRICNKNESPHKVWGLCNKCFSKYSYHKRKNNKNIFANIISECDLHFKEK